MTQPISVSILIVSSSTVLEQQLRLIPAPDSLALHITTCPAGEAAPADVLIYDLASAPGPLPPTAGYLEAVLYGPAAELAPAQPGAGWTALWPRPLADTLLAVYAGQLFQAVQAKKELSRTRVFLDTLIDSVPDLIWFKDLRGGHMKVNDAFGRAVGKTKEQCEGRGHYYIWDLKPDEYAKGEYVCLETEAEVLRLKRTCLFDEKVKSKNGLRQFKTYKSPLVDERGEMFGTVGIAKDVTDLQNVGRELEVILSSLPFGAMIVDVDNSIVSVNQKFCESFGATADQILAMSYSDVCAKILDTTPQQLESTRMTELHYGRTGRQAIFHAQQQSIHDIFGNHFGFFFLCLDVTNEYELQHRILHSANTDFLTGLYNRRYFYDAIGQQAVDQPISLVYFDLDDFKLVNDTYGHKSGDNALVLMADQLREVFRDQLIARLGGDEFVVAFFGSCVPLELARQVERFIEQTGAVFQAKEHLEALTVSAGIGCNGSSRGVDALLSCADKALYASKAQGKARCTVYGEPV